MWIVAKIKKSEIKSFKKDLSSAISKEVHSGDFGAILNIRLHVIMVVRFWKPSKRL